jgi:hypothetical protein
MRAILASHVAFQSMDRRSFGYDRDYGPRYYDREYGPRPYDYDGK